MMRNLRLLLAGLVVPVVLVTTTGVVQAEELGNAIPKSFTVGETEGGFLSTGFGADHKCKLKAYYIWDGAATVAGQISCEGEWDSAIDKGWNDGSTTLTFKGTFPSSGACSVSHSTGNEPNGQTLAYSFSTSSSSNGAGERCSISQVCYDGEYHVTLGGFQPDKWVQYDEQCFAYDMGSDTNAPASEPCQYGTPMRTAGGFAPWPPNTARYYYPWDLRVRDDTTASTRTWKLAGYQPGYNPVSTAGYQNGDEWTQVNTGDAGLYAFPGWDGPRGTGTTATYVSDPDEAGNPGNSSGSPPPSPEGFNVTVGGEAGESPMGNAGRNYTTHPIGVTVPELCIFWFGPKVVDLPDTDIDEPWAPLDTIADDPGSEPPDTTPDPPDPEDGGCDFNFSDPASWLSGGMCAAVGILKLIWEALGVIASVLGEVVSAIAGLADDIAGIAGAILDGLWDLLVPDPASWDIEGLVEQLQTRPPFSLLEPLADEATAFAGSYTSAGSCGVLADFGDAEVTCSDIQNAPGLSVLYEVVRIGLVVLTGWGLFRIFSQLFEDQG